MRTLRQGRDTNRRVRRRDYPPCQQAPMFMAKKPTIARQSRVPPAHRRKCPHRTHGDLLARWLLRLLVRGRGIEAILQRGDRIYPALLRALRLESWAGQVDDAGFEPDEDTAIIMRWELERIEGEDVDREPPLIHNIDRLGDSLALSECERWILAFLVLNDVEPSLDYAVREAGEMLRKEGLALIAIAIDQPEADVRAALGPEGTLRRSGLVHVSQNPRSASGRTRMELLQGLSSDLLEEESQFRSVGTVLRPEVD